MNIWLNIWHIPWHTMWHSGLQRRLCAYLREPAHAKNGRSDAPQVVVGLAVTREGLPVRSLVFSGETADVTTVETVKQDCAAGAWAVACSSVMPR